MSTNATPRISAFLAFYNQLSGNTLQSLALVYHPQVTFIDPVHELQGLTSLNNYFANAYARLQFCQFDAQQQMEQGDEGFVSWRMQFIHPAISKSKTIQVDGCSVLRWQDGLIIYHRDYYDLNDMVYRHLPVLGWLTGKIKQRMANTHA
ncbi:MAG: nuclear transport factor 2 family protein [Gammaproteobacteria bacterium]|nr:nuclear transport factor 2 family protein [Gammaproteobacteria bacterium]MBU1553634.1 nuclear transport factor 2 family protein [Gammaproteobacteria bacterium]MBU2070175.1 nuclear transport factor 2 family protein [Gammaproteobacteria bacterium]MBU2183574.1 nuclear transport factor 2 family protein [Gammaproteobacteria bacterium]MBU2204725.1 nuclear transport factor 2 family protein [Gammaproteobacteria bacterium]